MLLLSAADGLAQDATGMAPAPAGSGLEQVLVTAQKRSESIQSVPAQVNVIGAKQLDQLHVTSLEDIGSYVPGLQVNSGGAPGLTTLSLRGIAPIGPAPTVGTYIDDAPIGPTSIAANGASFSLDLLPYDLQRLEVLQGPQGTLYGANSIGGVVKYVLTQPDLAAFHGRVGFDVFGVADASDPGGGGRAMVSGPIVADTLGLLASYGTELTPGFIDNSQTGQKGQNGVRQQSGRVALLWKPNAAVTVRIGAVIQRTEADGNATVALTPTGDSPLAGERTDNNYVPQNFTSALQDYTADIDWDLGWSKLVSATSYSIYAQSQRSDLTRSYNDIFALFGFPDGRSPFKRDLYTKKVTQEFRLSSPDTVRLEWLVGGFYTSERTKNTQDFFATDPAGQPLPLLSPFLNSSLGDRYEEIAGFGDLTFHVTDRLSVAGGVRYAYNDQSYPVTASGVLLSLSGLAAGSASLFGTSSQGVATFSVGPKYQITRDVMTYVRIATGYQAGGPNIPYPGVPATVAADRLTNYELGLKSQFWNRRGLFDVALFYIDWRKIQIEGTVPETGFSYLSNGGSAKSEGVEANGELRPFAGLTLSGNVTYTDAVLTQDVPQIGGLSGDRLPYIPLWSGSVQADYSWALTDTLQAHVGAGLRLVDDRFSDVNHSQFSYKLGGYEALDLNGDISYGRYVFRVFVKNATDTKAYTFDEPIASALSGATTQVEGTIIQPLTAGFAVDARF